MKNAAPAIALIMAIGSGCNSSDNVIGLNENIHHDDLNYRVTSFEKRRSIFADSVKMTSRSNFYIVTFEVENEDRFKRIKIKLL